MPELPEVETIVRTLTDLIVGKTIKRVLILEEGVIAYPENPEKFREGCLGKKIIDISRRGKYIIISLAKKDAQQKLLELIVHLRMTGQLLYTSLKGDLPPYTKILFELDDSHQVCFTTIRKFSRMYLVEPENREKAGGLATLGIEPLSPGFTKEKLAIMLRGRNSRIKGLLLDQSFLAGLGNIYVDEALFRARINPRRKASSLSPEEIDRLHHSIKAVLLEGIKFRGTTRKDYVDAFGRKGEFQNYLQVYSREGEKCPVCNSQIKRIKVAGRSSFFCPACQEFEE